MKFNQILLIVIGMLLTVSAIWYTQYNRKYQNVYVSTSDVSPEAYQLADLFLDKYPGTDVLYITASMHQVIRTDDGMWRQLVQHRSVAFITALLLTWLLFILGHNYVDYRITRNGGKPNYLIYFLARAMASIIWASFLVQPVPYGPFWQESWRLLVEWLPYLLFTTTSFWIVYEIVRNIWTKKPLLYFDYKERDSGWIDRLFSSLGIGYHLTAKLLALAVCVLSVIVIYHRHG